MAKVQRLSKVGLRNKDKDKFVLCVNNKQGKNLSKDFAWSVLIVVLQLFYTLTKHKFVL